MSLWLSLDLFTIYRRNAKWRPDLVSQVLELLLTPDFVICVGMTKRFLKCHHCDYHVSWIQLQTRYKVRTRFVVSGSRVVINFKLCQVYQHNKGTRQMTSAWLSSDLVTIHSPDAKWGPDLVFLVLQILLTSHFVMCVGMKNNW